MPVQSAGRLVAHGLDRRKILMADPARLQQLPGSVIAGLGQQRHGATYRLIRSVALRSVAVMVPMAVSGM
jgi:hypothetical protein